MKLSTVTLCALALALLGGCHRQAAPAQAIEPVTQPKAPVAVQRGPSAEEQTAGMVEAATQGKSQTPVTVKFELLRRPVQGQPLEVAIALLPNETAGPATIEVSGQSGLEVPAAEAQIEFPSVEPAEVYRHDIKLKPTAEGVLLLTLTVNLRHDQLTDTRIFSVPLIVAASDARTRVDSAASRPAGPAPGSPAT